MTKEEKRRAYKAKWYQENKEKHNAQGKAWREANREKLLVQKREYYRANREECMEKMRAYYKENRETMLAQNKAWRDANKEVYDNGIQAWRKANPDKVRAYQRTRRARKLGADGDFTPAEWHQLLWMYNYKCACCGTTENLERDHVVPLSKGGDNYISNIQPLCRSCNASKNDKHIEYNLASAPEPNPINQPQVILNGSEPR